MFVKSFTFFVYNFTYLIKRINLKSEREIFMELFDISVNTYYLYQKQNRPAMLLLKKYFTKEDLEEFLKSGRVRKFDNIDNTITISIISFLQKLDVLYRESGNPDIFYNFIVYYIQHFESLNDWDDTYPWQGSGEIGEFQELFYQYLIDTKVSMRKLKHTSLFINQLSQSDLLFLNINILDGFELMFNFKNENVEHFFFSMYTKTDLLQEMKHGLKAALLEVASQKKYDSIKQIVQELIQKTRDLRIQQAEISPE